METCGPPGTRALRVFWSLSSPSKYLRTVKRAQLMWNPHEKQQDWGPGCMDVSSWPSDQSSRKSFGADTTAERALGREPSRKRGSNVLVMRPRAQHLVYLGLSFLMIKSFIGTYLLSTSNVVGHVCWGQNGALERSLAGHLDVGDTL